MDVPWKVIFAFVGVFVAGAIFGGVFTIGVSARRFAATPPPAAPGGERPLQKLPAVAQPKAQVAGPNPQAAKLAKEQYRSNPITPVLMNQFTRKLSGLTESQQESLRKTLGRAGEDLHRYRQENLTDVARVTERMYADVAAILTLEQRAQLETMRRQTEEKLQNDKKKREAAASEAAARLPTNVPATPVAPPPGR